MKPLKEYITETIVDALMNHLPFTIEIITNKNIPKTHTIVNMERLPNNALHFRLQTKGANNGNNTNNKDVDIIATKGNLIKLFKGQEVFMTIDGFDMPTKLIEEN